MPALSSDESLLIQEGFVIRDHNLDGVTLLTSKFTSIRSIDIIR